MPITDELNLSAEGVVRPVKLTVVVYDADGRPTSERQVIDLELIEMDFATQEKFMDQNRRRIEFVSGEATVKNFEGMRLELLSKCCRIVETGKFVTSKFFQDYRVPGPTVQKLFLAAQELNSAANDPDDLVKAVCETLKGLAKEDKLTNDHRTLIEKALETAPDKGE